ncbi:ankyrin repeat domain-containing protein [Paenibacillus sp. MBLB4367]|uniref:ankyrin repeat domain-containing protein n=1 Tax=Paenibacillus sp. MBLB4367 TaxID=3384767 RepID=UPI0039082523
MSKEDDLFAAIKARDLETVQTLIGNDPSLTESENENGISPILLASYYGALPIADFIRARKVRLTLHEAAALGDLAQVRASIDEAGMNVEAISKDGFSALGLASFFGHRDVAAYLLEKGADVNARSHNQMKVMPLHSAVAHRQAAIVELLLAKGANVNANQHGGWTPLQGAAHNNDTVLIRLLIEHRANINARNDSGLSALGIARKDKRQEAAALLEELGAVD